MCLRDSLRAEAHFLLGRQEEVVGHGFAAAAVRCGLRHGQRGWQDRKMCIRDRSWPEGPEGSIPRRSGKGSPSRGAGSAQPRLRGCIDFAAAGCLRRPYLFSRKRKDMEEKSAWGRGVLPASEFRQGPMFWSGVPLGTHLTGVLVRAA